MMFYHFIEFSSRYPNIVRGLVSLESANRGVCLRSFCKRYSNMLGFFVKLMNYCPHILKVRIRNRIDLMSVFRFFAISKDIRLFLIVVEFRR